ncbi:hypothetical protein BKA56DRAFT_495339, partial [Ilyonectria sp. MPI-CAGE-AT-0026]
SQTFALALVAQSLKEADSTDKQLNITSDLANPDDVVNAFTKVKKSAGHSKCQISSASTLTPANDTFALPLAAFDRDTAINVTNVCIAAQHATLGFSQLSDSASRTFIYTGNILNLTILPSFLDQCMGKFYYGDEQKADGRAKTQGPWLQILVKGIRSASPDDRYLYDRYLYR